jgi:autotransporter-associated beta strand protein
MYSQRVLRSICVVAVVIVSPLLASPAARGATYSWQAAQDDWSVASSWGGVLPSRSDYAYITNGGTASITLSGASCYSLSLGNGAGSGNVQLTGGVLAPTTDEFVGDTGTGSFTQSGGNNNARSVYLGINPGSSGSYVLSGNGYLSTAIQGVGYSGTGTFTQIGGTNNASVNGTTEIGAYAGSVGTYFLSGNGLMENQFLFVGVAGTGNFTQSGGNNSISARLILGGANATGGGAGTYYLSGNGHLTSATEWLGDGGTGSTGSFAQSGGTNNVVGSLYVGGFNTSDSGTYSLSESGYLSSTSEYLGYGGTGSVTQSGGTNNVSSTLYVGYGPSTSSSGTYSLNGGLLSVQRVNGGSGAGTFNFNGGTLQASGGTSAFVAGVTAARVQAGGAIIDVQGFNATINQPLLHDPALGAAADGGLIKVGSGTLALGMSNTYTGNTYIAAGTLALGNTLALQNSTLDTGGGGSLSFGTLNAATFGGLTGPGMLNLANSTSGAVALSVGNNNATTTFSGALAGPGSLFKVGSGELLITGSSTYSGPTSVNQGELMVNGSLASAVTVNSGGILAGTGSLTSVTVNAGGQLAPGDAPGTLTLSGSLTLLSGAALDYELDTPLDSDEILMSAGTLELNGQQFSDFNFTPLAGFGRGTYTLIDAGSITGSLGSTTSGTIDGLQASLAVKGDNLVLNVVPEPSTLALLVAGAVGVAGFARRWKSR